MRKIAGLILWLVVACAFAPPLLAQDFEEMADDLVRSDLPLFEPGVENVWPKHFFEDRTFGCISRVYFGDWALRRADEENGEIHTWYRIQNYGVFHCWLNVYLASEPTALDNESPEPSFTVFLGDTDVKGRTLELWALQMGARGGSSYLLLSRAPGEGAIKQFDVLQTDCPRRNVRDMGSLDILITRYCAINSKTGFVRFARRMAQRPPLGTLTWVNDPEEPVAEIDED